MTCSTKRTRELSNNLSSNNFCWYWNIKECVRNNILALKSFFFNMLRGHADNVKQLSSKVTAP